MHTLWWAVFDKWEYLALWINMIIDISVHVLLSVVFFSSFFFWHGPGADPEPPLPGGAQVTNESEGFTEARSAERGRVGEGVTPSRRWGSGGSPPGNFEIFATKWCILSTFWGNHYTFLTLKIYIKKRLNFLYILKPMETGKVF